MSETVSKKTMDELKAELGVRLVTSEQVAPPPGVPTGWAQLDRYLLWHGFPKSALSLMISEAGGATTLWMQAAREITGRGQWVAWMNEEETSLTPWALRQRGVDLSKLLCVSRPTEDKNWDSKQLLWALQELMSLELFEMVACDLGDVLLREGQVLKLKKLAMRYQTALVFLTQNANVRKSSFYSLILRFQRDHVHIDRALHRPTHSLERRDLYADTLPQLASGRRALCG